MTPGQTVSTTKERYRLTGRGLKTRWFTVFDAELEAGNPVVVKALNWPRGPHAERFVDLALTLTTMSSPHAVQVLDAGFHESAPFVVEEVAPGEPLSRTTDPGPMIVALALAAEEVRRVLRVPSLAALRGLLPERVRKTADGFKLSVLSPEIFPVFAPEPEWTHAELSVLAPEVARREKADARADVYSICALALQAVGGRPLVADPIAANALREGKLELPDAPEAIKRGLSMIRSLRQESPAGLAAAFREAGVVGG